MLVDICDVFVFNTTFALGLTLRSGIDCADGGGKCCNCCNELHDVDLIYVDDVADMRGGSRYYLVLCSCHLKSSEAGKDIQI